MAGSGSPTLTVDGAGLRAAIVAASWHQTVMDGLVDGAQHGLAHAGVTDVTLVRVPGAFELPVACASLAQEYDVLVALGVVIRGGTPHFDYVCQAATAGLTQVAVSTRTPVGFGVLTCDDDAQALDRAGLEGSHEDKGHEAATAAVATAVALRDVTGGPSRGSMVMLAQAREGAERLTPQAAYAELAADPNARLVDLRTSVHRADSAEIPGSLAIDLTVLPWRLDPTFEHRIPEATDWDQRWILMCNQGYVSSTAADQLRRMGLTRVTDIDGGYDAWVAAGLPTFPGPADERP